MDGSWCATPHLLAINDTLTSLFDDGDPRLDPRIVADCLHAVAPPPCARQKILAGSSCCLMDCAAAAFNAAAAPARINSVTNGGGTLATLRPLAAARGLAVDAVTAGPASVVVDRDARGGRRVVLFRSGPHYLPAVAIRTDRLAGADPTPRHSRLRCVADAPPPGGCLTQEAPHSSWTDLFLSADGEPTAAGHWQEWSAIMATLEGPWGPAPPPPQPVEVGTVAPPDAHLDDLAGWADYHRTCVRVNYGGRAHFRILPRRCAAAHEGAKAGRGVYVEVGAKGGRLWYSPVAAQGWRPYADVYVESGVGGPP